jgi:pimeloyl-ACP methyl ester carboxylesterase
MRRLRLTALVAVLAVALAAGTSASTAGELGATSCAGTGDVTFRAADGIRLVGHRFGRGTTTVVLAHQSRGSLCQWLRYARRLASLGYGVLAFDFRNHGLSQRVGAARSYRLAADVTAAVRFLRARGARKVYLVGASMGGAAALASGAATRPPVAGVVSLSAPAQFTGVDAAQAVPRLNVPVLFLAAADDASGVFASDARALHDAAASTNKRIEILPGSSHGVTLVSGPGRARDLVEEFLRSA